MHLNLYPKNRKWNSQHVGLPCVLLDNTNWQRLLPENTKSAGSLCQFNYFVKRLVSANIHFVYIYIYIFFLYIFHLILGQSPIKCFNETQTKYKRSINNLVMSMFFFLYMFFAILFVFCMCSLIPSVDIIGFVFGFSICYNCYVMDS